MLTHLPGFERVRKHVYDLLDPDVFWETHGGHHWLCTAPWDRRCDSSGLQQAEKQNLAQL